MTFYLDIEILIVTGREAPSELQGSISILFFTTQQVPILACINRWQEAPFSKAILCIISLGQCLSVDWK